MDLFTTMRWNNADWYTANPLETMTDEQLTRLAGQVGMVLDDLRRYMVTPHVEATCPLCGQPQTHLTGCKGCGGDAWGWEFEEVHGADAADRLRERLRECLGQTEGIAGDRVPHTAKHAYGMGGCLVCAECWRNVIAQPGAYMTCPLVLISERLLAPHRLPSGLLMAVLGEEMREDKQQAVREWLEMIWMRWTETWNTIPEGPERRAVAMWRATLLNGAFALDKGESQRQ